MLNRQLIVTTTALGFVGGDLALQGVRVGISPLEAGVAQRAEFNLRKAGLVREAREPSEGFNEAEGLEHFSEVLFVFW